MEPGIGKSTATGPDCSANTPTTGALMVLGEGRYMRLEVSVVEQDAS